MTLEEKTFIGKEFGERMRAVKEEGGNIESILWEFAGLCLFKGEPPEAMIEMLCLGANEIHIDNVTNQMLKTIKEQGKFPGTDDYNAYVADLRDIAKKLDLVGAVEGTVLPVNMILGEAFIKVGNRLMSDPSLIKG